MSRLRDERGYTVFELLFAATLFVTVLLAAFGPMDQLWGTIGDNERQNESQEATRRTMDRIVTELRSAGGQDVAIERAGSTDIVFGWVDPHPTTQPVTGGNETGVMRVRYCLDGLNRLIRQERRWTTATPPALSAALCPELAPWVNTTVVAKNVDQGGAPLFAYNNTPCVSSTAPALTEIDAVGVCLRLNSPVKANERATPTQLATIVAIRNEINGTRP